MVDTYPHQAILVFTKVVLSYRFRLNRSSLHLLNHHDIGATPLEEDAPLLLLLPLLLTLQKLVVPTVLSKHNRSW